MNYLQAATLSQSQHHSEDKVEPDPTHGQRELGSDAFSYYSNKFNLMKTLLMKDDDDV